jgi:uncharacterized circularly permuted ATP-grasp superfamily protein
VPIHGLLKRVDDPSWTRWSCAPTPPGRAGLLQAVRAGNVLVANAPGSAFLESPALLGFLPALARHLLGETLPAALPTWWCGERAAMEEVLAAAGECAIKPTYPGAATTAVSRRCSGMTSRRELDEWAGRIAAPGRRPHRAGLLPLSQMPTWQRDATGTGGRIVPRSAMLRVFAVANGPQSWQVLPGGLARIVAHANAEIASMQRGGSSADVWVMTRGAVDRTTLLRPPDARRGGAAQAPGHQPRGRKPVLAGPLHRTHRKHHRAGRLTLECLNGEDQSSPPLLDWLDPHGPGQPPGAGREHPHRSRRAGCSNAR